MPACSRDFSNATVQQLYSPFGVIEEKLKLEMVAGMDLEILDGHHRSLFKGPGSFEKLVMTLENFDFHSNDPGHFKSHLFGNGLYRARKRPESVLL